MGSTQLQVVSPLMHRALSALPILQPTGNWVVAYWGGSVDPRFASTQMSPEPTLYVYKVFNRPAVWCCRELPFSLESTEALSSAPQSLISGLVLSCRLCPFSFLCLHKRGPKRISPSVYSPVAKRCQNCSLKITANLATS